MLERESELHALSEGHHKLELQLTLLTLESTKHRQEFEAALHDKSLQNSELEQELGRLKHIKQQYDEALLAQDEEKHKEIESY